jgi:hypothetical protein
MAGLTEILDGQFPKAHTSFLASIVAQIGRRVRGRLFNGFASRPNL